MTLYGINKKKYKADTSKGIKLESKRNRDKWVEETITINGEEVSLYYSNEKQLSSYTHFFYNDSWYRIPRNMATILMPETLYTKSELNKILKGIVS